jgi:hypothetical protein
MHHTALLLPLYETQRHQGLLGPGTQGLRHDTIKNPSLESIASLTGLYISVPPARQSRSCSVFCSSMYERVLRTCCV